MAFTFKSRTSVAILGILTATASACSTALAPLSTGSMLTGLNAAPKTQHRFTLKFNSRSRKLGHNTVARVKLPSSTDLRNACSPIADQGQLGSCTAFAWGKGMAEYIARKKGDKTALSALFFYVKELEMENHLGQDAGAESMETGAKVLQQFGDTPDTNMPYLSPMDQMNSAKIKKALSTLPNAKQLKDAEPYRAGKMVPVADLAAAKEQLAKGSPVAMGIMVYESFQSASHGNIPVPNTDKEQLLGGHAVLAVGYDDAKQALIMRNSWGTSWGDKGWFYLPYGYITKDLVLDCWSPEATR